MHLAITHHFYTANRFFLHLICPTASVAPLTPQHAQQQLPSFLPAPCMQSTAVHSSSTAPPCVFMPRASQDHIYLCVLLLLYQELKSHYSCQSSPIPIHLKPEFPAVLKSEVKNQGQELNSLSLALLSLSLLHTCSLPAPEPSLQCLERRQAEVLTRPP